jgi:hypothetical protein
MRWPSVFVGFGVLAACRDPLSGPFDGLPVDGDFAAQVGAPVQHDTHSNVGEKLAPAVVTSPTTQQPILCDNRDLLDTYYLPNKHFDAPSSLDQIVAAGESRWVFH